MVKKLLAFFILCMVLALVRTLLMVLAVVLLLALVHAFVTRPRETLGCFVTLILSSLALAQPLAFIGGALVIVALAGFGRWRRGRHPQSLLPVKSAGP
ncbi:hypothetical protein NI456_14370 [Brevundimonas diminuta]|uniref:hypothetical protein n=1 Tax=Brevundimonas diminuta TaxID=293 RepID=UPI002096A6A5|nr:hypothetical protein [Brevundimonas diminuta]MCO8020047.1 hypothetical protein [Brevundimonas diminuta]MCO8022852.1 hypothetical protein [Brevundimonas diminuta]